MARALFFSFNSKRKKKQCRLPLRKGAEIYTRHYLSLMDSKMVQSWLILTRKSKGYKQGNGIVCSHCDTKIKPSAFEIPSKTTTFVWDWRVFLPGIGTVHAVQKTLVLAEEILVLSFHNLIEFPGDAYEEDEQHLPIVKGVNSCSIYRVIFLLYVLGSRGEFSWKDASYYQWNVDCRGIRLFQNSKELNLRSKDITAELNQNQKECILSRLSVDHQSLLPLLSKQFCIKLIGENRGNLDSKLEKQMGHNSDVTGSKPVTEI
ncbi:hypothetical protein AgCh_036297 [Apium graveolens]